MSDRGLQFVFDKDHPKSGLLQDSGGTEEMVTRS